jgi:archaellum biogenesis protein FlaJ (TadC family)
VKGQSIQEIINLQKIQFLSNRFYDSIRNWYKNFMIEYREIYDESGITLYFNEYIKRTLILTVSVVFVSAIISNFILESFLNFGAEQIILSSITLSMTLGLVAMTLAFVNPVYQRNQSMNKLEKNMLYSMSYMAVLSSSGMPIERILRRLTEVEDNPPLKALTHKFLINISMLGKDILTALSEMADASPSKQLAKAIESIRTTIMTSGDLKTIIIYEVERQMQKKKEKLKASVNTLVYIGEIYVTMMVVTPVLFILMITIMSIMGGVSFGGSSILQLNLIIFFGIPIMGAAFIIILDQVLEIEE